MLYFAYGSNMLQARIEQRLGACRRVVSGWIEGYVLRFHKNGGDGSGKCDCFGARMESNTLRGVVYELSLEQAKRLDAFEGPGYTRQPMEIRHATGRLDVDAYLARPEHIDAELLPFSWYKGLVLAGAMQAGLPDYYVEGIRAIMAVVDPDHNRRILNESLIGANVI